MYGATICAETKDQLFPANPTRILFFGRRCECCGAFASTSISVPMLMPCHDSGAFLCTVLAGISCAAAGRDWNCRNLESPMRMPRFLSVLAVRFASLSFFYHRTLRLASHMCFLSASFCLSFYISSVCSKISRSLP